MMRHGAELEKLEAAGVLISDDRPEPSLSERLADEGFSEDDILALEGLLEAEADRRGRRMAAETLRIVLERVGRVSAAGAAVRFALTPGACNTSAMAAELQISKQAIGTFLPRVRSALGELAPIRPMRRPDLPGRWLTRPEARAEFGVTGERLAKLKARTVAVGMAHFVDADDLAAKIAARRLAEAAERLKAVH